ncbi:MAG TPA: formyltetrahydrofolate deformylase, partial [Psychrobacter sp.]|nr:formyltetrahydrofolate deformylase [Psychrobacter sp.]
MSDNTTTATASIKSNKNSQNSPVAAAIDTATLLIKCRDQAGIV